jgi:hypothetical protein
MASGLVHLVFFGFCGLTMEVCETGKKNAISDDMVVFRLSEYSLSM